MDRREGEPYRGLGIIPISQVRHSDDVCTAAFSVVEGEPDGTAVMLVEKHLCPGAFASHELAWDAARLAARAWIDSWLDDRDRVASKVQR